MPFMPIRPPVQGSVDQAAQRIYNILEREEQAKGRRRSNRQLAQQMAPGTDSGSPNSPTESAETLATPVFAPSQTHPYPPPSLQYKQTPENRERLINWIIDRFENGYSNDPDDSGGETMWGIT